MWAFLIKDGYHHISELFSGSPVISALMGLGEKGIGLKCTVEVLEFFVCEVYAKISKLRKIDALRWKQNI
jgi:hypothetical protein